MNPANFQHACLISLQKLQAIMPACEIHDNYLTLKDIISQINLLCATCKFEKF
jgi:hypothetical protein